MKLPLDNWEKLVSQENEITGCATSYFLSRTDLLLMIEKEHQLNLKIVAAYCCNSMYYLLDSNFP